MTAKPAVIKARLRVAQARIAVENALMALDYADSELKAEAKPKKRPKPAALAPIRCELCRGFGVVNESHYDPIGKMAGVTSKPCPNGCPPPTMT